MRAVTALPRVLANTLLAFVARERESMQAPTDIADHSKLLLLQVQLAVFAPFKLMQITGRNDTLLPIRI